MVDKKEIGILISLSVAILLVVIFVFSGTASNDTIVQKTDDNKSDIGFLYNSEKYPEDNSINIDEYGDEYSQ